MLWIDDQPDMVESYLFAIEPAILEEGFAVDPIKVRSLDEAMSFVSEEGVVLDNVDLVLIDYHLDSGVNGDVVAKEIRKRVPYKDIVFYSSDEVVQLQRKIFDQRVEGVYCAHRQELVSKVRGLFKDIVRKVVDLEHTRGIVLGATSDYEQVVTESIINLDKDLSDEHREELVGIADKVLHGAVQDLEEIRTKLAQDKSFARLMKKFQFSAYHRIELTARILEAQFGDTHSDLCDALRHYRDNTMPKRNKLGHMRVRIEGSTSELRNKEVSFTIEDLKQLRRDLVEYIAHFERLAEVCGLSN